MKSYFLEGITSLDAARVALRATLPGQENQWLPADNNGNAVAYFNLSASDLDLHVPAVIVDISGRHSDQDENVVRVLRKLQTVVGGIITYSL